MGWSPPPLLGKRDFLEDSDVRWEGGNYVGMRFLGRNRSHGGDSRLLDDAPKMGRNPLLPVAT